MARRFDWAIQEVGYEPGVDRVFILDIGKETVKKVTFTTVQLTFLRRRLLLSFKLF